MRGPARPAILSPALGALLLAGPAQLGAQAPAFKALTTVHLEGGSRDDQAFARAAAGLEPNHPLDEAGLRVALAAIRATDRFRGVQGALESANAGLVARIQLDPWPPLQGWTLADDGALDPPGARAMFPELRRGIRVGLLRREEWREHAEQLLRASGFPAGRVAVSEAAGGAQLAFTVQRGAAARVRRLAFAGHPGIYGESRLWEIADAVPGRTLWTLAFRREALARLRKRFLKDKRYEWTADFEFAEDGTLTLKADPGPVVQLRVKGASLGFGGIKELAPLARAERYGPELLDEGDRRIYSHLRDRGFLDPAVEHRREVVEGTPEHPATVRITYLIKSAPPVSLGAVRFQGNEAVDSRALERVAALPKGVWGVGVPKASPDLMQGLEDRVRAHYLRLGYADVKVRRAVPVLEQGRWAQTLIIREGNQRHLAEAVLKLPPDFRNPWALGEDLVSLLGDRPLRRRALEPTDGATRIFEGDHFPALGLKARLERSDAPDGAILMRLRPEKPLPFVKGDLLGMVATLRGRLSTAGVQRPRETLDLEEGPAGLTVRITLASQATVGVRRLAVVGADRTRARAVLREAELEPGAPMSAERLGQAQARVANLGAFHRVDLEPLREQPEGSLSLKLSERNPWVFSHGFGYDRSQGYHFSTGVQRLNVGGMGRSVDFGIRAGDATINNAELRKWFPTGDFTRSIDQYSLGYSDPRFALPLLGKWLPERVQYRAEAAYVVEKQSLYETRRRRMVNTLDWRINPQLVMQVGHRFERTEVLSAVVPSPSIQDEWNKLLFETAKIPGGRTIISAPFAQVIRDTRDSAFDPTRGTFFSARVDLANQLFGTSTNSSFVKLDMRHQWNWPIGHNADRGVAALGVRLGVAHPTARSAEEFPLSERFFAGGPFTHRGVEPDQLGPRGSIPLLDPGTGNFKTTPAGNRIYQLVPVGGQGLALINLEYRFPVWSQTIWAEVFLDSGQVYRSFRAKDNHDPSLGAGAEAPFPPFRTALGIGLIIKLGLPIKIEYAADVKKILGRNRSREDRETELQGVLISAGFQF